VPELFERLAGELPKVETPWEQILRSVLQTAFQETNINDYSRPSRRWLAMERNHQICADVSLPFPPNVKKKRGTRLAVALDTSGSIDESLLGRFSAEIAALCGFNQRNLIFLVGDAAVYRIGEIDWRDAAKELSQTKYTGGGGTDFRPVISAAAGCEPDALVYLIDLFGEMGDKPDFPVIWAARRRRIFRLDAQEKTLHSFQFSGRHKDRAAATKNRRAFSSCRMAQKTRRGGRAPCSDVEARPRRWRQCRKVL